MPGLAHLCSGENTVVVGICFALFPEDCITSSHRGHGPLIAKGLLKTAIREDNQVVIVEYKRLYTTTGPVPEEEYNIPFGQAMIRRNGDDATLIVLSAMVAVLLWRRSN